MGSRIRKGRKSIFREVGLVDDPSEHRQNSFDISDEKGFDVISGTAAEGLEEPEEPTSPTDAHANALGDSEESRSKARWLSKLTQVKRPRVKAAASAPTTTMASLSRLTTIVLLIAVALPAISYNSGRKKVEINGADAGVIKKTPDIILEDRADSPVDVCLRWAQQCKWRTFRQCYFTDNSSRGA